MCWVAKVPGGLLERLVPARAWGFKSPLHTLQVHASQSWEQGVSFGFSLTYTLQVHCTERSPQVHLFNASHTSVSDAVAEGLVERGTISLFDCAEQLRQVTQRRERFNDVVERECWGVGGADASTASAAACSH